MKTGKEIQFESVIKHADYKFDTLENDLCLIKD